MSPKPAAASASERSALATQHAPLVRRVAYKLAHAQLPVGLEVEDLVGYGAIGLMDALDRYDPERGVPFEAFATLKIKGAILDGLRRYHQLPDAWQRKRKVVEHAMYTLESELGREPTDGELGQRLEMGPQEVAAIRAYGLLAATLSLDELFPQELALADPGAVSPEEGALRSDVARRLETALARLTEKERLVLALVYKEDLTLTEVGHVIGLTTARCSQIHRRAIVRLRGLLGSQKQDLLGEGT